MSSSVTMPDDYVCGRCGARECKLWHQPQSFTLELLCAVCAAIDQGAPIVGLTEYGTRPSEVRPGTMTNEIGKLMPAVPSGDRSGGYWGYTSGDEDDWHTWRSLPSLPTTGAAQ